MLEEFREESGCHHTEGLSEEGQKLFQACASRGIGATYPNGKMREIKE